MSNSDNDCYAELKIFKNLAEDTFIHFYIHTFNNQVHNDIVLHYAVCLCVCPQIFTLPVICGVYKVVSWYI